MARRSIWNGAISFGMVVIPVKLYTATESKDIAFVTLHKTCNNRIRQKRYCSFHESEVEMVEIVKGYEYAKEQYVVMDQADFDDLPVASTHTIEIVRFVDLADIDPVYFERSYALEPDQASPETLLFAQAGPGEHVPGCYRQDIASPERAPRLPPTLWTRDRAGYDVLP